MQKIPPHAKKVFEGIIFDVFHWDQELFDGTVTTFEALKRKDSVSIIAVVDGMIMVNHEEQPAKEPFLAIPGGNVDEGSPLINAKRELLEETGYESDDWQEWQVSDPTGMTKLEWSNHLFIARNCKKTHHQQLDGGEKIEVTLVSFEDFIALQHNPLFRNKDLSHILEKIEHNEEERNKFKKLLGLLT